MTVGYKNDASSYTRSIVTIYIHSKTFKDYLLKKMINYSKQSKIYII